MLLTPFSEYNVNIIILPFSEIIAWRIHGLFSLL